MNKKKLIISHVKFLSFYRIPEWDSNSVKDFTRLILDGENIHYTEEDLKDFILQGDDYEIWKLILRYAKLYEQVYSQIDAKLAYTMQKVARICNEFIKIPEDLDKIFSGGCIDDDKEITIKKGESITFHNGSGSDLTSKELESLLNVAFSNNDQEKQYKIEFSANVPEELKKEVEQKIKEIFEEFSNNQEKPKYK